MLFGSFTIAIFGIKEYIIVMDWVCQSMVYESVFYKAENMNTKIVR